MATDSFEVLPSPAQHFDHDFRSPAHGASDQLDLVLRQVVPAARPAAGIGRDVQERLRAPTSMSRLGISLLPRDLVGPQ